MEIFSIIVSVLGLSAIALLNLAVLAFFLLHTWRALKPRLRTADSPAAKRYKLSAAHR